MNPLLPVFLYSLLPVIVLPSFAPTWVLTFFAPFLIIAYYKQTFIESLWWSLLAGVIIDLLSATLPFGLHSINYCLVCTILYQQKQHFFEDSLTTIPILTFLFAASSTLLQAILLNFFDTPIPLSWQWLKVDLLKMSLWDGFYAFTCFTIPSLFLPRTAKRRESPILRKVQRQ